MIYPSRRTIQPPHKSPNTRLYKIYGVIQLDDPPLAACFIMHAFAIQIAIRHGASLAFVFSPVTANRAQRPWRLQRGRCHSPQVRWYSRGHVFNALSAAQEAKVSNPG